MVEKQIYVRVRPGFPTSGGAEQKEMLNTQAPQFGLMRFQQDDGGLAIHGHYIATNRPIIPGPRHAVRALATSVGDTDRGNARTDPMASEYIDTPIIEDSRVGP